MSEEFQFPNRATPVGSRSYYCIRIAAPERRQDLALLFLWHQELNDILYRCSDPGVDLVYATRRDGEVGAIAG